MLNDVTQLRGMLRQPGRLLRAAGAHNAVGARLAEQAGFDALWASSLEISTSYGVPDTGILTMTEMLAAATNIAESVRIPVICDCDTGFGDAENAYHMVRKYEAAGTSAVCIADAVFPKCNSLFEEGHRLEEAGTFCQKIQAAKEAQRSPEFIVIARIEAFIARRGLDEAIARADAYAAAGADAILVHSNKRTPQEVMSFVDAWKGEAPLLLVPTTYHALTVEEAHATGKIRMLIYANQGLRAALVAMRQVYRRILIEGSAHNVEKMIAPLSDVFALQGFNFQAKTDKEVQTLPPEIGSEFPSTTR
jgi:phosphoenolpyruvate phosphomutase